MKNAIIGAVFACLSTLNPAFSGERQTLGWGRLFTNDFLGDGNDRWRTGSYTVSAIRGPSWSGVLPTTFGEIIEYRLRTEIIAPENLRAPLATDRRYVGAISAGIHTHFQRGQIEMSAGVDLIIVGPQTKLADTQEELHDLVGAPKPNIVNFQVPNAIYPTLTVEAGRTLAVGANSRFRPFVELQVGAETLARVGGDLTLGRFGEGGLQLRDVSTGQRFAGIASENVGTTFILGGDAAYVADSRYLATSGIVKKDARYRLRAGVHQEWQRGSIFYGATYLSREFEAQSEGQVLGSINLNYGF